MDDLEGSTSFGNIHIEAISHMAPSTLGHQSASYVSSGSGIVVVVAVAVFAVLLLLLLTFVILIILIILNIINVNINQSSSSTWSSSPPSSSSSSSSAVIWHKASNNIKPNYVLVCWIDISLSSCNIIVLTTSVPLPSGTVLDCVYVLSSFKIRCMHHEKVIPKASPTSDVAASSFEVSASICSTAWRQQPSSTWVKKRVAKTPHISLLQSNLLLCWQPVAQSHTKSTASSFCWGDGSSQTCHQEAQIHIITQLPVFGQNKREKKHAWWTFSQPSVLVEISTQSVTGQVLNHPINDTVMVTIHVKFLTWSCHCITVLPLDSLEKPKASFKTHWFAWRPNIKNI